MSGRGAVNRRPRAAARRLLPVFDEQAGPVVAAAQSRASCRRGCAHCCFKLVEATLAEGVLIAARALESPTRVQALRSAMHVQLARMRELGFEQNAYFHEQHACVFLDPRSRDCSIYAVRPTSCRLHFVVSDPEQCSPQHDGTVAFLDTRTHALAIFAAIVAETSSEIPLVAGPLQAVVLAGLALLELPRGRFDEWLAEHGHIGLRRIAESESLARA